MRVPIILKLQLSKVVEEKKKAAKNAKIADFRSLLLLGLNWAAALPAVCTKLQQHTELPSVSNISWLLSAFASIIQIQF